MEKEKEKGGLKYKQVLHLKCVHLRIGDVLILILFLLNFYNFYDDYTRNIAVKKKTHTTNILIYI